MCGIAGFVGQGSRTDLEAMTRALAHRGPDDEGFFVDNDQAIFLGHRRLSIIDIDGGHQPMSNELGSTTITFNGEIYNHRDLRLILQDQGYRFSTDHSDTEVLIRAYDAWGDQMVGRLDGMFAFAIWDARRKRVLLARDRFGEKPLFYTRTAAGFAFASELPALRLHPAAATRCLNHRSLQMFFAYTFLPGTATPYQGIYKLLPGSTLSFDLQAGELSDRRYWRYAISEDTPPGREDDWIEEISQHFRNSVASRLQSDVDVGVFLSGGLDSSAISAVAACGRGHRPIRTFSIGFNERTYDESKYAQAVATHIGSSHSAAVCSLEKMYDEVDEILNRAGEPLGDPSLIPTYMLAQHAAGQVKVALSGDGGDELFAGYDPFKALRLAYFYKSVIPRPVHRGIRMLASRLPPSSKNMGLQFRLTRATRGLSFAPSIWNPVWLGAIDPEDISRLFGERVSIEDLYGDAISLWDSSTASSPVDRTLEFFGNLYLSDDILVKSDRAGMLNGLEIRAPFLAPQLVDYVLRLPHRVKFRSGTTKWIFKEVARRLLPRLIVDRPKKGFGIPLVEWLRHLPPTNESTLPFLSPELITRWHEEHVGGRRDHRGALWCSKVLACALKQDTLSFEQERG